MDDERVSSPSCAWSVRKEQKEDGYREISSHTIDTPTEHSPSGREGEDVFRPNRQRGDGGRLRPSLADG